jgi:hypothetical protein
MPKNNEATKNDVATEEPILEAPIDEMAQPEMPTITLTGNAAKMEAMRKQMESMKTEMAEAVAVEVVSTLEHSVKNAEKSTAFEIPTPNGNYLTAKMASAIFMALRDEVTSAYIRCEKIQADKFILMQRKEENSFRSDVERAACERSLSYYESLDERLDEITTLISDIVHIHALAVKAQHDEDNTRQQDIPVADRTYTTMPELRWVSSADKVADPSGWEHTNDMARVTQQALFWMNYNT